MAMWAGSLSSRPTRSPPLPAPILSLVPAGLVVDRLLPGPERILLVTRLDQDAVPCPSCAHPSARRHSAYQRRLADLPWQGRLVELRVRVRRLRCANAACPRAIFAERLPGVTLPKARRTVRLGGAQTSIGLALGGEPGSRLAGKLTMPASGDTLLRLARAAGAEPITPPRVRACSASTTGRGGAGSATAPSSATLRRTASSTSYPTARPRPWPIGSGVTRASS